MPLTRLSSRRSTHGRPRSTAPRPCYGILRNQHISQAVLHVAGALNQKELMPSSKTSRKKLIVLLVESDVLVRFALAEHLRACEITVIEAVSADDAKAILVAGPVVSMLVSDAQLAGQGSGFVLAQWVRRHRSEIETILTGSIASKVQAVTEIAARVPDCTPGDAATLTAQLNAMLAERKRRLRQQTKSAPVRRRQKRAP